MELARLDPIRAFITNRAHGGWLQVIFATMVLLIAALLMQLVDVTWHSPAAG